MDTTQIVLKVINRFSGPMVVPEVVFPPAFQASLKDWLPKSRGLLVWSEDCDECSNIGTMETTSIDRPFSRHSLAEIETLAPTGSWLMAILLCQNLSLEPIARFAASLPIEDRSRVEFFEIHPGTDSKQMFKPWIDLRLGKVPLFDVEGATPDEQWHDFHKIFGRRHAERVYADGLLHPEWFTAATAEDVMKQVTSKPAGEIANPLPQANDPDH